MLVKSVPFNSRDLTVETGSAFSCADMPITQATRRKKSSIFLRNGRIVLVAIYQTCQG